MTVFKRFLRAGALLILCVLLVYAPEIYIAVSGPTVSQPTPRVLLRIALCTQDAESAASFYRALSEYRKLHGTVHLRVLRVDADQLAAMSEPLPDVYCFYAEATPPDALLLPLDGFIEPAGERDTPTRSLSYACESGQPLLFSIGASSAQVTSALSFITFFQAL